MKTKVEYALSRSLSPALIASELAAGTPTRRKRKGGQS
jgi:hypothetical protein